MTTKTTRSGYKSCQSLVKGLKLLQELNRSSNGAATVTELSSRLGMHRTTVKRMLETLVEEDFVYTDHLSNFYRLSHQVQSLSYGFRDSIKIVDIVWPHMMALTKELVWPCSYQSLEGHQLVVRASTHAYSVFSFHTGMPGRKLGLMNTAAGRAYLAYCSDAEREALISMISRDDPTARTNIPQLVEETRRLGYGRNRAEWAEEPKFAGVARPIVQGDTVLGCINMIILNHAISDQDVARFAARLGEVVATIQKEIA
ncbi:helix-turn-helix domain-containing protein [Alkalilimnicola sp. S0819]|uniref:helix-turn-helix domain-containing protein n=1 Tax=Alkalilimnicola sp. S0819 TaxID=2613922 RepID=UPI001262409C|nr:helix-turn-helix domain-containing protein [Alkalilimnicola sp. S0819]KAB7624085.1 helix-turn-helix domain-containing protein [Alkalilimnicola sp. S0819]MPQ16335.1 helix-turn-helix domain-containing protein [Alkalilimnicola sp. S0819]